MNRSDSRWTRLSHAALRLFALMLLTACGEPIMTTPGPATISIRLEPATVTIAQGGSTSVTGFATVGGSFTGSVDFAVTGLPTDVTIDVGDVVPPTGTGLTFSVPIDVNVGAAVAPGTYTGTVTATGSGTSAETTYSLTVVEASAGSFELSEVADLTLEQGTSANRLVQVTRSGGFTGNVTITVEGVPSGVTATPSPMIVSGASTSITILADGAAATGASTLTVRGTAAGLPDVTRMFDLTVTTPTTTSDFTFDYSMCVLEAQPVWVAVQDGAGTGTWSRVTEGGASGGIYEFSVTQNTFGLAIVTDAPSETGVAVGYYGVAQFEDDLVAGCTPANTKNVGGEVSGTVGLTSVAFGGVATPLFMDGSFIIGAVPEGVQDFVGYSMNNTGGTDRMVIVRDLDIPNNGLLGTIDFAAGLTPATATLTVDGLAGGESGFAGMEYSTMTAASTCAVSTLYSGLLPSGGATTFEARSAPPAAQMADEYHVASLTSGLGDQAKRVKEAFSTLANRTIAMPADVPAPTMTDVSTGAYLRLEAEYTLASEFDDLTSFGYTEGNVGMAIFATGDAMSTDVSFTMPDFSGLPDWDDAWAIPALATGVQYSVTATGLTGRDALCTDGGRQVQTIRTGSYN